VNAATANGIRNDLARAGFNPSGLSQKSLRALRRENRKRKKRVKS
jgi:hypothetical protein